MVLEMEENGELEEGEACFDNANIDPDTDLSYIDERIHNLLGHFQKDFEGGVSADNLGAKFGGYGSFLPTYERSPTVWSHPKSPQKNQSISRSPNNLTLEGASQALKAPSDAALCMRLGTVPSSDRPSHNSIAPSVDISVKKSSRPPSVQVAEKCALKDETPNRSANQTDQRPLKFRIKMSSDNLAQKNAIYIGLGLDDSPSSSSGNSSEESGGRPPVPRETVDESLSNIIKVMTSFPIPGDVTISPLHDSLLCLTREEKFFKANKGEHSFQGVQDNSAILKNRPSSKQRDGKVSKEKAKSSGKRKRHTEMKHGNGTYVENDITVRENMTSDKETIVGKEFLCNGSKCTPKTNTECDAGGSVKVIGREPEVLKDAKNDEVKDRLFPSKLRKEEPFESLSGQDCRKNEKQSSMGSFVEKISEPRFTDSFKDAPNDLRDDSKCKGNKISVNLKGYSDVSKSEEGLDLQRKNIGSKNTFNEHDETNFPRKKEKQSFEGKNKSKGSLGIETVAVSNDKKNIRHSAGPCSSKTQKLKSHNSKAGDSNSDLLCGKDLELTDMRLDPGERHTADKQKPAKLGNVEVDKKSILDNAKETVSGKKVDERVSLKGVPGVHPPVMGNGSTSQVEPAIASTVLIEEDWVCCDRCQTWRLLPFGIKPEQLPEKWLCSMQNWLPGMSRCDFSEEDTTKALRALYQVPVSENQNKLQNHVNSADFQRLDQTNLNPTSQALSNRGKKRHGSKEMSNLGNSDSPRILNPTTNHLHEPVKSRSLNDMSQSPLDSNQMKKSGSQHMSKPYNLILEKDIAKVKEKHANGGNSKETRNKSMSDADQYACETSMKPKTEGIYNAVRQQDSNIGLGKAGPSSSTNARVKGLRNGEYCLSKETKFGAEDAQISIKKSEDQGRATSGSERSMKKRKLKDWQDNQTHIDTFDNSAYNVKAHKEVSRESGFRKEKKCIISKADGKESSSNSGNDKFDRKDRVAPIILSGVKSYQFDRMGKDGIVVKDLKPRKHCKKDASQQALDGAYSSKKDLGSGHVSMAATSSSSKVSGSHKVRGKFEEAKGSPVESVSSSPLRTTNLDKFTRAAGDVLRKDDAVNGGFPSVSNSKKPLAADANGETNRSGTLRKEISTRKYQNGDTTHDFSAKDEPCFEVGRSHLFSGNVVDQHVAGQYYDEVRVKKNDHEEAFSQHKSCKVSTLQFKDKGTILTSDLDRGKGKVADLVSEYSQKNQKYDSKVEPNHLAPSPGTATDVKHSSVKKLSIKTVKEEKNNGRKDYAALGSNGKGLETQLKRRDDHGSDVKLARYTTNGKIAEGYPETTESKSSKSKISSHPEIGVKREVPTLGCQPVPGSEGAGALHTPPIDESINDKGTKMKHDGSASSKIRVSHSSIHLSPDRQGGRDVDASSPVRKSSDVTATGTLQEAKELRDYADRLKSSGFAFESSEAYFQAALKFLHGAVLLEACGSDNGRHGEMTQMQIYTTTAKLCELCAHEYERRQEMAAAALAYKCMEIAYMRVVYCKHSSTNRDRHELQATLHIVPQGESPSSSASDVDNLNTQVIGERAALPRGASHVAGNHVIASRSRTSFVRLLDFTQDVNFAMEASRMSQNAFMAANATLEEAQNKDCIASIRRVVDFSFQDIEELIRLVRLARESISRSGFGGARD